MDEKSSDIVFRDIIESSLFFEQNISTDLE